jgi:hypothetical protein
MLGDPNEPLETPTGERGRPLRWWQIVLILLPFAAIILYAAVFGR